MIVTQTIKKVGLANYFFSFIFLKLFALFPQKEIINYTNPVVRTVLPMYIYLYKVYAVCSRSEKEWIFKLKKNSFLIFLTDFTLCLILIQTVVHTVLPMIYTYL